MAQDAITLFDIFYRAFSVEPCRELDLELNETNPHPHEDIDVLLGPTTNDSAYSNHQMKLVTMRTLGITQPAIILVLHKGVLSLQTTVKDQTATASHWIEFADMLGKAPFEDKFPLELRTVMYQAGGHGLYLNAYRRKID